jgi:hypothetical protein
LKKTRAAKAKLKIQEFAEEKEDRDPQPLDPIQISRKADSRQICRSCEGDKPREIRVLKVVRTGTLKVSKS